MAGDDRRRSQERQAGAAQERQGNGAPSGLADIVAEMAAELAGLRESHDRLRHELARNAALEVENAKQRNKLLDLIVAHEHRLGKLEGAGAGGIVQVRAGLVAAWRKLRRRLGGMLRQGDAVATVPPPAWEGAPSEAPLVARSKAGKPQAVVLALVTGMPASALEAMVGSAIAAAEKAGVRPIFLTDQLDFTAFRRQAALFEHLPDQALLARTVRAEDARLYRDRRMALILRKWRPLRVIAYGESAGALKEELRASAFIEDELKPLLGGAAAG